MMSRLPTPLLLLLLILLPALCAAAGFERVGSTAFDWDRIVDHDARSAALGGSDLATAAGPSALWQTPAPLFEGHTVQASYHRFPFYDGMRFETMAVSAEQGFFRFGICHARQKLDRIRTAFDPEDLDVDGWVSHITVAGASIDIVRLLDMDATRLQWTAGANTRQYSHEYSGEAESAFGFDLGTTFGWTDRSSEEGWVGLRAAVAIRNILDAEIGDGDFPYTAPQTFYTGGSLEGGYGRYRQTDLVRLALTSTHRKPLGEDNAENSNMMGCELLFCETLSLRRGLNRWLDTDAWSWGVGLDSHALVDLPVSAAFHYTKYEYTWFDRTNLWTLILRIDL